MASIVLPKKVGLFRYSNWDIIPVAFSVIHLLYLVSMFLVFTFVHAALAGEGAADGGDGDRLLLQHLLEHQRHLAQLHPQPLLQLRRC